MHTHPYLLEIRNNFGHNDLYPFSSAVSGTDATAVAREMRQEATQCSLQPAAQGTLTKTEKTTPAQPPSNPVQSTEERAVMPHGYLKQDHKKKKTMNRLEDQRKTISQLI